MGAAPGNENTLKHGGARAVEEIKAGQPLTGPAQEMEEIVRADLSDNGRLSIVKDGAIRLQAVANIYYGALIAAAEEGDLKRLDTYAKRFGWLQGAAIRAWREVREEEKNLPDAVDYETIIHSENTSQQGK